MYALHAAIMGGFIITILRIVFSGQGVNGISLDVIATLAECFG